MMPARKRTVATKRKAEKKENDSGGKKKKSSEYLFADINSSSLTVACLTAARKFHSAHDSHSPLTNITDDTY